MGSRSSSSDETLSKVLCMVDTHVENLAAISCNSSIVLLEIGVSCHLAALLWPNMFQSRRESSTPPTPALSMCDASLKKTFVMPQGPASRPRRAANLASSNHMSSNTPKCAGVLIDVEGSNDHREHSPVSVSVQKNRKLIDADDLDENNDQILVYYLMRVEARSGTLMKLWGAGGGANRGKRKVGDYQILRKAFHLFQIPKVSMREKLKRCEETLEEISAVWIQPMSSAVKSQGSRPILQPCWDISEDCSILGSKVGGPWRCIRELLCPQTKKS
ncbi:hypothetical protein Salat_2572800 [Sesamum alatum]|uniref:Uncharacterized protein n=1 Tax=Sesamum alatum TaxID=300844 RepID=A0AAE1XT45_9LAMI|nr:hypothetical protein Salat_2572800 [Sesamum alatum]